MNGAFKELPARIFAVSTFHQRHAGGVNRGLIVTVIEFELISDRFDLQCRRNQQRRGQSDLTNDQNARNDVNQPAGIPPPAFLHHSGSVAMNTDQCGDKTRSDRRHQSNADRECEDAGVDRELNPVRQRKR